MVSKRHKDGLRNHYDTMWNLEFGRATNDQTIRDAQPRRKAYLAHLYLQVPLGALLKDRWEAVQQNKAKRSDSSPNCQNKDIGGALLQAKQCTKQDVFYLLGDWHRPSPKDGL